MQDGEAGVECIPDPEPTTVPNTNTVMLKSKPAPCETSADSPLLPEGPILISNGLNDFDANPTARQLRSLTRRSKVASIFLFIARFVGFPVLGSEFIRPLLLRILILIKLQFSTLMTKPIKFVKISRLCFCNNETNVFRSMLYPDFLTYFQTRNTKPLLT